MGRLVGFDVGKRVGATVGRDVGRLVGSLVGSLVGRLEGFDVGKRDGLKVGGFVNPPPEGGLFTGEEDGAQVTYPPQLPHPGTQDGDDVGFAVFAFGASAESTRWFRASTSW